MSTETLSAPAPATSVGIETSPSTMSAPSFGTEINTGGTHSPDLNAGLFSQTSELTINSVDSFDKVVPGDLAFTHTETLWQASTTPAIEPNFSPVDNVPSVFAEKININLPSVSELENVLSQMESKDTFQTQEPEIETSENAQSLLDSYAETLVISEAKVAEIKSDKEVIADAEQAVIVKEAWIAIGASEGEATESVFNALDAKLQKQDIAKNLNETSGQEGSQEAMRESDENTKQAHVAVLDQDPIQHENEKASGDTEDENLLINKQYEAMEENTDEEEESKTERAVGTVTQAQEEQEPRKEQDLEKEPEMPMQTHPDEAFFEEDAKADNSRKEYAEKAVAKAAEKVSKGEAQKINGAEIAEALPNNPQPDEAISEIIKEARKTDGSYTEMAKQIAKSGEIDTPDAAKKIVEKAIEDNPAVRVTSVKTSRSVSDEDVKKVLRGEVVLFDKVQTK